MATHPQHHPSSAHTPAPRHRTRRPSRRLVEQAVVSAVLLTIGVGVFRAVDRFADDAMLALIVVLVLFLAVGSLFAGDDRRRP